MCEIVAGLLVFVFSLLFVKDKGGLSGCKQCDRDYMESMRHSDD